MLSDYLHSVTLGDSAKGAYENRCRLLALPNAYTIPEAVVWEATRRCDMLCRHCGTPCENADQASELTTSQVKDVFGRLDQAFCLSQVAVVSITGGEPTLRNDLVEIVDFVRARNVPQVVVHTNGKRCATDSGLLEDLVGAGVTGVGINLDGVEGNHNWLRRDDRAFRYSLAALSEAKRLGVDTMVSTVLSKRSVADLRPLRELVMAQAPGRWRLIPLEPIGRANAGEALSPDDMKTVLNFVLETLTEFPGLTVEMGCGQWYGKKLEGLVRQSIWYCIAGIKVMGILYDGMIGSCNNIDRAYCQGNALEDDIAAVWKNGFKSFRDRQWCKGGECSECGDWGLCRGGEMHLRDPRGQRVAPCFYRFLEREMGNAIVSG